eukprot:TRINITY_DN2234_c0_g1_i7.p2 TRINITY_DN2234_c0_g1~~TRINITY_DN2234_c0_g1_i7.p2  ORF type:complete len:216 (-),score=-10.64 TRINITY_DN2234_c0_g1_i7:627-1274(-)
MRQQGYLKVDDCQLLCRYLNLKKHKQRDLCILKTILVELFLKEVNFLELTFNKFFQLTSSMRRSERQVLFLPYLIFFISNVQCQNLALVLEITWYGFQANKGKFFQSQRQIQFEFRTLSTLQQECFYVLEMIMNYVGEEFKKQDACFNKGLSRKKSKKLQLLKIDSACFNVFLIVFLRLQIRIILHRYIINIFAYFSFSKIVLEEFLFGIFFFYL